MEGALTVGQLQLGAVTLMLSWHPVTVLVTVMVMLFPEDTPDMVQLFPPLSVTEPCELVTVNALPTIAVSTAPSCAPDLLSYSLSVNVSTGTVRP
ncbi:MAG: hypothetical protein AAFU84_22430, partial [Cyanobacteria bacterium J06633_23]